MVRTLSILALLALSCTAHALSPAHLSEMPSPQEVFEIIEGSDASDTAAKRAGAMLALADMIAQRAGDRYYKKPWLTADENKLRKVYQTAEYSIVTPMLDSFDKAETARLTVNSPRAKWYGKYRGYGYSEELRGFLLNKFFTDKWAAAYRKEVASQESKLKAMRLAEARAQKSKGERITAISAEEAFEVFFLKDLGIGKYEYYLYGLFVPAGLLVLVFLRELQPFGITKGNEVRAGFFSRWALHGYSGQVVGSSISEVSHTTVHGGQVYGSGNNVYSTPVSSSSYTTTTHRFFLHNRSGREQAFETGTALPIRDGHAVSVVWAIPRGKKRGPYLVYVNDSTGDVRFEYNKLKNMMGMSALPAFIIPVIAMSLWLRLMAQQTESTGFLVAVVLVFVICLVIQSQVTKRRIDRLKVQLTDFARQSNF